MVADMIARRRLAAAGDTDPAARSAVEARQPRWKPVATTTRPSRLGAIACPTMVACGRYDGIAPPANSEVIAAGSPAPSCGSTRAGTFFLQDRAALPEILDFLATG